jgi:hypothetical protein
MLAIGKERWYLKDLDDQLNMYRQQLQADQNDHITANMAGEMSGK